MELKELTLTEARYFLKPHDTTHHELIVSAIKELVLMRVLIIEEKVLDDESIPTIGIGNENSHLKTDYQKLITDIVKEFNAQNTDLEDKESLLTPSDLIALVYEALNFKSKLFTKNYIHPSLYRRGLLKHRVPSCFTRNIYTTKGKELKEKLELKLFELINDFDALLKSNPNKLKTTLVDLEYKYMLAEGFEKIEDQLIDFLKLNLQDNLLHNNELYFNDNFPMIDIDLIDFPSIDMPDFSGGYGDVD
jgi:hypothetical protein